MLRARGLTTYTPHALVWHWEARPVTPECGQEKQSADYHFSATDFCARKHFPALFPLVLATLFVSAARRVMRTMAALSMLSAVLWSLPWNLRSLSSWSR